MVAVEGRRDNPEDNDGKDNYCLIILKTWIYGRKQYILQQAKDALGAQREAAEERSQTVSSSTAGKLLGGT